MGSTIEDGDVGRGGVLRFEHLRGGKVWAADDPRYRDLDEVALHLEDVATAALVELIRRQAGAGRPVTFVVANLFAPWAFAAAAAVGVPAAMLWTQSCTVLSLYYHYFHSLAAFPAGDAGPGAPVVDVVPGLPAMSAGDLPAFIHLPEDHVWRQMLSSEILGLRETASWVLVNTFDELEHAPIEALRAHLPILPVGPLIENDHDHDHDGGSGATECTAWLDAQPPGSVVFVAFGSVVKLTRDDMAEVAAGLASTGRPFLWVVRDDTRDLLCSDAAAGGRGKVVPWCEQRRVLSHHAVGCFVTHCGWNSTTEALAAGVPVVAYPVWSDQNTNAAFLVDVCGAGVRLPASPGREVLRRRVEEIMGGGSEEEAMRARAREWKGKASAAVDDGGSSERAMQVFVDAVLAVSRSW
jgi:hypothetical protein